LGKGAGADPKKSAPAARQKKQKKMGFYQLKVGKLLRFFKIVAYWYEKKNVSYTQ